MNTAVVNVKVNPKVKREAQKIAEQLGLSLSSLINGYLKQIIRTKRVSFDLSYEPTDYLTQALEEAKKDREEGFVSPSFDNVKDAITWLDNPKRKYENQIRKKIP
jgi:DNA-damage-inducible protein J